MTHELNSFADVPDASQDAKEGVTLDMYARVMARAAANDGPKPEKIIHLVSDGMSMGTLTCADYLSQIMRDRPLSFLPPDGRLAQSVPAPARP